MQVLWRYFCASLLRKESFSMNNMTTETMKETTRKVLGTAALFIGSFCVMGCVETPVKAQPSAAPSGLVDLTQAAETSVNAVVYIKVTTNSKTKTVDVQDPFSDFFGDSGAEAANSGKYRLRNVKVQVRE